MHKKLKSAVVYNKETVNLTSNTNYIEIILMGLIICYLAIDFLPNFGSIEISGVQFLYLSGLNCIVGVYFYYNPFLISQNLIGGYKKPVVKLYLLFLMFCGISIVASRNFYLGIVSFYKLIIVFTIFINWFFLLNNRLYLIYKIVFLISISIFLQSYRDLYHFIQTSKLDSIINALDNLKGNTGNINILSASLSIKIPFLLLGIVHFTKWKKYFLIVTLLMASMLILLSGSRAAYLSLFIVTILFIIFYLKLKSVKKDNIVTVFGIILPIIVSLLIVNQIFEKSKSTDRYQSVTARLNKVADFNDNSTSMRLALWNNALKIVKENPIIGIGLGNWEVESIPYEKTIVDGDNISHHTHNDFLEIAAETGILNGIVYVTLFIILVYTNLRRILKSERHETKIVALLVLLLIISYGIDASFNFPLYRPTMQLGFCFFFVLTLLNETPIEGQSKKKYFSSIIPILIVIISIVTTYFSFKTFKAYQLVNDIGYNFLTENFTLKADEIVRDLPQYPNVYNGEPFANYACKYFIEEKRYKQAEKYINWGNKINPYIGKTEYYKSIIAKATGKQDSANFYAKKALKIRPRYKDYYYEAINSAVSVRDTIGILQIHKLYTKYNNSSDVWVNSSIALEQSKYGRKKLTDFIDSGLKKIPKDSLLMKRKKTLHTNFYMTKAEEAYQELKYDKALKLYIKALNEDPDNALVMQNIGVCHYNLEQYNSAISFFKKSLRSSILQDGKSEYFLGVCYITIKNKEKGCAYLDLAKNKKYSNASEILKVFCK